MNLEVPGRKGLAWRREWGNLFSRGNVIFAVTDFIQWFFKNWFQVILENSGTRIHFERLQKPLGFLAPQIRILTPFPTALSQSGEQAWQCTSSCQWTMLGLERAMHDHIYCSINYFFLNCPEILERKQASVLTEELSVNSHFSHGAN